jgi:hypothetical protein
MSDPTKAPLIEPALIEWLANIFPNKCPAESDTEREIWIAVGAQKVVRKLRAMADSQSKRIPDVL